MRYYTYEEFRDDTNNLIKQVKEFKPQAIIGIARGGLTLAHTIAEGLEIRDVQTLRTELYDKTNKRDVIKVFNNCNFETQVRVLVVDDIADSGETLKVVMGSLKQKYPHIEFLSATIFYKKSSIYEPDFWITEAKQWIEFFWEKDFLLNKK